MNVFQKIIASILLISVVVFLTWLRLRIAILLFPITVIILVIAVLAQVFSD